MGHLRRKRLPHEIPPWVDPHKEIYFLTVNCRNRGLNQLAFPETGDLLFETVQYRQEKDLWWPHIFLAMPDHVHALMSFPLSEKPMKLIIEKWKEWTAKSIQIDWQRNHFEHRLRHDESRRQKAEYILQNPVRKKLVSQAEDWPFVYFAEGQKPEFDD